MRTFGILLFLSLALVSALATGTWEATPAAVDRLHGELYFATNDMVPWVGKHGSGNAASLVASLPLPVIYGTVITSIRATNDGVFVLINGAASTYPTIGLVKNGGSFQTILAVSSSGLASDVRSFAVDEETSTVVFAAQASDSTWGLFTIDYAVQNARVEPLHAFTWDTASVSHLELHEGTLYYLLERAGGAKEVRSLEWLSVQESVVSVVSAKTSSMRVDDQGQLWIVEDRKSFYRCALELGCEMEAVQLRGRLGSVEDFVVVSNEEVVVANGMDIISLKLAAHGRDDPPPVVQIPYGNNGTNITTPTATPTPSTTVSATPTTTPTPSATRSEFPSMPANFTIATMLPSRSTNHSVPFPVPSAYSRSYTPIITASNTPGINATDTTDSPRSPIISTEGWELIAVFAAILCCSLGICLFICWKRTVRDEMAMSLRLPDSPDDFL